MAKGHKLQQYKMYEVEYKTGKIKRKSKFCPRCQGVFLAQHKDRMSCGACGYTEVRPEKD